MNILFDTFRCEKGLRFGYILLLSVVLASFFIPMFLSQNPNDQNLGEITQPPSLTHPFGTDFFGRDVLSRVLVGGRVSLIVGVVVTTAAVLTGTIVGVLSGFLGGWADAILMRIVDVMLGFPRLFILLMVIGLSRPSFGLMLIVLSLFSWMDIARVVRAEVLTVSERLYVKSAVALGLTRCRILFGYILPNVMNPIIVSATLLMGTVVIVESSLSFIGLGIQPPYASWGTILNQGFQDLMGAWWMTLFTGIAVVVTVVGFNLLGDGLRNILDPKMNSRVN